MRNDKIKILHVIHSLNVGGMENCLVNIINTSDECRFEHVVCCIGSDGPMRQRIKRAVKVYSLNKGQKASNFMSLKIARIVISERPDIVHTRNWGAVDGILGAWMAGTRKVIHDERGRDALDPSGSNSRRKIIRRLLVPLISCFVTVSEDLARWLVNEVNVPLRKVLQISNGVDSAIFHPADDKERIRQELNIPQDSFVVGSVGRLDPVKDFTTLITAFQSACQYLESDKLFLLIVGSGPEEDMLTTLVKDLKLSSKVVFTGARRDVPELLRCMDLFVLSSIAEGIPNTVLEAMATGLPVIATDVGGVSEVLSDGTNGWLVPSGDPHKMSDKICQYFENGALLELHGHNGRMRSENLFSLKAMICKYEGIYERVYSS